MKLSTTYHSLPLSIVDVVLVSLVVSVRVAAVIRLSIRHRPRALHRQRHLEEL